MGMEGGGPPPAVAVPEAHNTHTHLAPPMPTLERRSTTLREAESARKI